jgi:predicted metal-binding membrane protein
MDRAIPSRARLAARIVAGAAVLLQVAVLAWAVTLWLGAGEALGRNIALAVVAVAAGSFALTGLPAAILVLRDRRPILALLLSLAFPLLWALLMSVA